MHLKTVSIGLAVVIVSFAAGLKVMDLGAPISAAPSDDRKAIPALKAAPALPGPLFGT